MRYLSTLFILLVINSSLIAQNVGVNLPAGTAANTMLDVNGSVSFREGTTLTCVNGVNSNVVLANYSFYRITGPTADFSVTGFGNGTDGRVLTIINASGQNLTLSHLTTSTSANQINTGGSAVVLPANGVATFIYNVSLTKWIVSGTMGNTPSFTGVSNGAFADSMLVVNNGVPLRVRPSEYIENYAWGIDGNNNITDGTHFLGTTTNTPLSMRVNNVRSGYLGTTATNNTFLGYQAGSVTTGTENTFIGVVAGAANTTGDENTAVGNRALQSNTTGFNNTAIGTSAMYNNTTGANNTTTGFSAMNNFQTSANNTANGYQALAGSGTIAANTGSNNTAMGYQTLSNVSSGTGNVGIGYQAGLLNTTGSNNVFIGNTANASSNGLSNAIAIGANATVGASNTMVLGGTGANAVSVGIGTATPSNSLHVVASSNPAKLVGLQTGTATDNMLTADAAGVVRQAPYPQYVDIVDLIGASTLTAGTISATATASTLGSTNTIVYTTTFTLTRTSLLLVDAIFSGSSITNTSNASITDGSPRMVKSYWLFSGSTNRYGSSVTFYTNTPNDTQVLVGILNNNNGFNTILAAGTYTLQWNVLISCSSGKNIKLTYGGNNSDRVSIKAIQLQ